MNIYTVGGFNEVGKNMSVVETGDDVFIFDIGLYLPPIVELEEQERQEIYTEKRLRKLRAIPDDILLDRLGLRKKVRAIFLGHAHLDHLAIPYLAQRYNAEIIATPFTVEVLRTMLKDEDIWLKNKIKTIQPNSSYTVNGKNGKKYLADFINITHSTPQTSMIALHTPEGNVLYANDFKFDNNPILGKKPNYEKLKELAREGVKALIVDSLYSAKEQKTPSEKIARGLLEDVLMTTNNQDSCIIVTTFSSHIARLKSIVDFGKQLNRKIVFLGRSLNKYVSAAEKLNLVKFKGVEVIGFKSKIKSKLSYIEKDGRGRYLIVCTGNQGEPKSVLSRLVNDEMPFRFLKDDHVIFSCATIPSETNIKNRGIIESKLKNKYVRLFKDIHVSGHASKEDHRDLINMLNPKNVIPAHGDSVKLNALGNLAKEMDYKEGKNLHIISNGKKIVI